MKQFIEFFKKKRLRRRLRKLPLIQRESERLKNRYPDHDIGFGSYGRPHIHTFKHDSRLVIGKYCSIANGTTILLGGNHRTDWISSYPFPAKISGLEDITNYEKSKGNVIIGNDVWLCTNCTILSGVTIGDGAVVAAGSVVSRDVAPYSIVAGNPAQHIRWRFEQPVRERLLDIRWWDWPGEEVQKVARLLCSDDFDQFFNYAKNRK